MTDISSRLAGLSPEQQRLLKQALKLKLNPDAVAATPGHPGGERPSEFPASFAQRRLWLLDRLEPGSTAYSMSRVWRIPGPLDVAALERAVSELVRRHETLRTHLEERDGDAVQVVAPPAPFRLEVTDLSALAPDAARAELDRLARADAAAPFRLEEGPLFRASLVRLAADDHTLLWNLHHAVTDGWSNGILARELKALYQAFSRGEPSPLAPVRLQYGDHALRERERLSGDALARLVGFWREALEGAPTLLEIAPDRPLPAVRTHRGAAVSTLLDDGLAARVDALARAHDVTPFMVYLAAFQLLLGRYARQEDVLVGTAVANRPSADVEGIVGLFVNTLVLRGDLSGDPTFAQLLGRVREATLGAFEHQALPFEKLVDELNPERSLTHAPLVQAVIVLHNQHSVGGGSAATAAAPAQPAGPAGPAGPAQAAGPARAAGPALRLEAAGSAQENAPFDLSLELVQRPDGVGARLSYATDLFERGTIERMLGHLRRVLEQVGADAGVRLSRLELLGRAEYALVLEEWNRTAAGVPADRVVHELFEEQAARTPDAVAVRFEEESLTYAQLNERANRLAHHLRGLGVGPDARVGVCVERSLEMMVGVLGVLKAGGAYVPLDPGYPAERLAYMLEDSAPAAVLVQTHLLDRVESLDVPLLELDAAAPAWASLPATDPGRGGLRPEHLAYVIYTSGSTGRPKGVRVPHGSLGATLAVAGGAFGFGAGDLVPSLASFAFDIWLFETLLPLLGGATVRLVPRERVPDVARLVGDLASCTSLHAVPALMRRIVEEVRATPGGALRTLRHAFVGGDAVAPDLLEEMRAAFPAAGIHVLYGPTEAAIICAAHRLGGEAAARQMVGRPLGNATLYVVEPGDRVAPVGVPGELCLGGASVARDYLGRPGLTAERFVPDPFSARPGGRLYRTGDRVRWLSTGELEFLGRTDHQVKIRGFRIEPGEIEARLVEHAGVREAVVLVREDAQGEKRLVAYVTGDDTAGAEVLRAHLAERLPEYMVPAAYVRLETLPLNPNGKVDRKALPAPDGDAFPSRGYEAPSGNVEGAVAAIWADLLGVERVGRHDDFFHLGGNSLLATRLVFRIKREMDVEISMRDVFEKPELSLLAQHLLDQQLAEFDPNQIEELLAVVRAADAG